MAPYSMLGCIEMSYLGMAVRLAYALGLHRTEAQRMYEESERALRSAPR